MSIYTNIVTKKTGNKTKDMEFAEIIWMLLKMVWLWWCQLGGLLRLILEWIRINSDWFWFWSVTGGDLELGDGVFFNSFAIGLVGDFCFSSYWNKYICSEINYHKFTGVMKFQTFLLIFHQNPKQISLLLVGRAMKYKNGSHY